MHKKMFKPTLENLLTPRPCRACGRMMDVAFLKAKQKAKSRSISATRAEVRESRLARLAEERCQRLADLSEEEHRADKARLAAQKS